MEQHQEGVFLRRVEFWRPEQHGLYFGAYRTVEPERFRRSHFQRGKDGVVLMRQLPNVRTVACGGEELRPRRQTWSFVDPLFSPPAPRKRRSVKSHGDCFSPP